MERTLVLIKPDAIQRGLIGDIITRLERKGLKLIGMKMMNLDEATLDDHYRHLLDRPFFPRIKQFMRSAPVLALCWEGLECVETVRTLCGTTNSRKADPGTVRGDLGMSVQCNLVHASDSSQTAQEEITRFFRPDELFSYESVTDAVIYSSDERG
ncbi:MAG: nucleoside-diphosphate kinase [Candidatus Latescibacteria bacterium]|nr:nucleoside-diphosphate kinase [Candidatus Latescibacterota bacterium]